LVLAAAGCGYSRAPAPSLGIPAPPQGFRLLSFPTIGVSLSAPSNWITVAERPPLVTVLTSGDAVIALWRYARVAPPPAGRAGLGSAIHALIAQVRSRQPQVRVIRTAIVHLGGASGIELDALERIKDQLRRIRSTHLYAGQQEIVLEQYAPPAVFHIVDHAVFSPVRHSLRVTSAA
jgi:hypothetical protein